MLCLVNLPARPRDDCSASVGSRGLPIEREKKFTPTGINDPITPAPAHCILHVKHISPQFVLVLLTWDSLAKVWVPLWRNFCY